MHFRGGESLRPQLRCSDGDCNPNAWSSSSGSGTNVGSSPQGWIPGKRVRKCGAFCCDTATKCLPLKVFIPIVQQHYSVQIQSCPNIFFSDRQVISRLGYSGSYGNRVCSIRVTICGYQSRVGEVISALCCTNLTYSCATLPDNHTDVNSSTKDIEENIELVDTYCNEDHSHTDINSEHTNSDNNNSQYSSPFQQACPYTISDFDSDSHHTRDLQYTVDGTETQPSRFTDCNLTALNITPPLQQQQSLDTKLKQYIDKNVTC